MALQRRPFLAAAGYDSAVMLAATLARAGIVFGLAWALQSGGLSRDHSLRFCDALTQACQVSTINHRFQTGPEIWAIESPKG